MLELIALGYAGMFLSALVAATLFPLSSEVVLATLLLQGLSPGLLLCVATAGNVLGSCVNYYLGYKLSHLHSYESWRAQQMDKKGALMMVEKYGAVSLLLSWAPVIGDPITFIAGVLRTPLVVFIVLVGISKCARYALVIALTDKLY